MRKVIYCLLLASVAATPALADRPNRHNDDNNPRQQQVRDERPSRDSGQRPQYQRPANADRGQSRGDYQRPQFNADAQRGRPSFDRNAYAQQVQQRGDWQRQQGQQGAYWQRQQQVREQAEGGYNRDAQQQRYQGAYGNRGNWAGTNNYRRSGGGTPFRADSARTSRVQWNRDWRNDRRYDWQERRYRDRSRFHLGLYVDPFGWGYEPYSIGYELRPDYYQQNYWIDPAMYGLPYPPPGTQWVRYWNDAVLVDMYSGQVVDAIQGFFW